MAEISYTPEFHHTKWVDNVDRVQADGPNGFNVRFSAIERELKQLSTVVAQINAALHVVAPPPKEQRLTLKPAIVSTDGVSPPTWSQDEFGAAQAFHTAGDNCHGTMDLTLPDNVRLISLRVAGRNTQATGTHNVIIVTLTRSPILADGPTINLAQVRGETDPYDAVKLVEDLDNARVDTSKFRYTIAALAQSITDVSIMTITGIEIIYIAD